jgi:hypothetical protein
MRVSIRESILGGSIFKAPPDVGSSVVDDPSWIVVT